MLSTIQENKLLSSILRQVVFVLGATVLSLSLLSCGSSTGVYRVAVIDIDSRRSLEVIASTKGEENQAFYYLVKNGGRVVVTPFIICSGHDSGTLKFKVITAKNGDLVGLFEERYPDEILALHDFSSDQSWPQSRGKSVSENDDLKDQMLRDLQKEHPDQQLLIATGRSCN